MGFRTIAISKRAKLNLTMGYLEVRGEETVRIFLDDIDTLLIENPSVSMTAALLSELMRKKNQGYFLRWKEKSTGRINSILRER